MVTQKLKTGITHDKNTSSRFVISSMLISYSDIFSITSACLSSIFNTVYSACELHFSMNHLSWSRAMMSQVVHVMTRV